MGWRLGNELSVSASVTVLAAAMASTAPALAAEEPIALEELIVTAQKREMLAQETPGALTVFARSALESRGVASPQDLQLSVPGLTFGQNVGAGGAQVALRGIGSENMAVGGDPGVAIHIDGVYNQAPTFLTRDFFDVERVEVLRGPQGTLYGRNATGGSINIITRQPGPAFSATARVTLGSYDQRRAQLALGGPLAGDMLSGRLSLSAERRSGYVRNVAPGAPERDADTADYWTVRAQLRLEPNDRFNVTMRGYYLDDDSRQQPLLILQPYPAGLLFQGFDLTSFAPVLGNPYVAAGAAPNPTLTDVRRYRTNYPLDSGEAARGLAMEINLDLGWSTLTALTGVDRSRSRLSYDIDASDAVSVDQTRADTHYRTLSQEVRLASQSDGPIQWLAGLYYYRERSGFSYELVNRSFPGPTPGGAGASFIIDPARLSAASYAAFGQLTWRPVERLEITAGLRSTRDRKTGEDGVFAPNFLLFDPATFGPIRRAYERKWRNTSGSLGVKYDVSDDVMAFASVSTGYKAGGINFGGFQDPYNPEKVLAYEAGIKSSFWSRRAQLNVAAFYYDYEDLQVFQIQELLSAITNAAKATSKGVEVELAVAPAAGLLVEASASWLDATYDTFRSADPTQPGAGVLDLAGNRLNRSPEWKFSLGAQYAWDLGAAGSLMARADFAWVASQYYRAFNRPLDRQPSYHRTDLRLTWRDADERFRVEAWVRNLEDEDVLTSVKTGAASLGPTFNGTLAPPRTYGVTFGVDF